MISLMHFQSHASILQDARTRGNVHHFLSPLMSHTRESAWTPAASKDALVTHFPAHQQIELISRQTNSFLICLKSITHDTLFKVYRDQTLWSHLISSAQKYTNDKDRTREKFETDMQKDCEPQA